MTFFGISLAAFFTPLAVLAVHGVPGARLNRAAEELTMLRTATGAFGITLMGVVQFRRTPFHQLDLAEIISAEGASLRLTCCRQSRNGVLGGYGPRPIGELYSPGVVFVGVERRVPP
jgi:hypothetical protein